MRPDPLRTIKDETVEFEKEPIQVNQLLIILGDIMLVVTKEKLEKMSTCNHQMDLETLGSWDVLFCPTVGLGLMEKC